MKVEAQKKDEERENFDDQFQRTKYAVKKLRFDEVIGDGAHKHVVLSTHAFFQRNIIMLAGEMIMVNEIPYCSLNRVDFYYDRLLDEEEIKTGERAKTKFGYRAVNQRKGIKLTLAIKNLGTHTEKAERRLSHLKL